MKWNTIENKNEGDKREEEEKQCSVEKHCMKEPIGPWAVAEIVCSALLKYLKVPMFYVLFTKDKCEASNLYSSAIVRNTKD